MRVRISYFASYLLLCCAVFGQSSAEQTVDRVYRFGTSLTDDTVKEITIALSGLTGATAAPYEAAFRTLTLHGTADQIAIADHLFHELEQPAPPDHNPPDEKFQMAGTSESEWRVLHWAPGTSVKIALDIYTSIRVVAGVPHLLACVQARALVMRGTADQMALAEWMFRELDSIGQEQKLDGQRPTSQYDYVAGAHAETAVRIVYLAKSTSEQQRNDIITAVRSTSDTTTLFHCGTRALVMRSTEARVAAAEWVIEQLNRAPATGPLIQPSVYQRRDVLPQPDLLLRIRYVYEANVPGLLEVILRIAGPTRSVGITSPPAVVLSDIPEFVALADWLMDELDPPLGKNVTQPRKNLALYRYRDRYGEETVVRVLYPNHTSAQRMSEMAALLRTSADVRITVIYEATGALVFRCKPEQLDLAEWLVAEQDKM
jgi:predicted DNA-binding ribbon-helix-helix protein